GGAPSAVRGSAHARVTNQAAWYGRHGVPGAANPGRTYGHRAHRMARHVASPGGSTAATRGDLNLRQDCVHRREEHMLWQHPHGPWQPSLPPLSLSRLNHGQPGVQAHPEIVQGTAELHHEIADALLPQPDPVFHNATTLHTAVDMLNPQSAVVERLVGQLLLQGQLRTAWLLRRHEDL